MNNLHNWNWMSLYWLLWIVVGFGVPEFSALWSGHPENTLSDNVWLLEFRNGQHFSFATFGVACLLLFMAGHFLFRMFR